MNVQTRPSADAGARPRRFTTDDVFRMIDAGVLGPDEKIELIEGEIVALSPKKSAHEHAKSRLLMLFSRRAPEGVVVGVETTLYLADDLFIEPDVMLYPAGTPSEALRGADVLLAVEVADSTLKRDLGPKAAIYARHGVRDYWVLDTERRRLTAHRTPSPEGYQSLHVAEADAEIAPLFAPDLRLRVADLL